MVWVEGRSLVAICVAALVVSRAGKATAEPQVVSVDDETRVRRGDAALALASGKPLPPNGGAVTMQAFRGETVAFQVVLIAGGEPVRGAVLAIEPTTPGAMTPTVFAERYLHVDARSRNRNRPAESLGWLPDARPRDEDVRGEVPDALMPGAAAEDVPPGQTGAFWVDLQIPDATPAGSYRGTARLTTDGAGGARRALARFDVIVDVLPPRLPYRATPVTVFYETAHLERRIGAGAPAIRAERQLWQLFHAHHLDALAQTGRPADIARLAAAYDGSLFTAAEGYDGPGQGLPPSVVAIGTYGALGAPSPEALSRADEMQAGVSARVADVFLYAVDEQCGSPLPGAWKRALAERPAGRRVRVGATCDAPPAAQTGDIAIVSAASYARATGPEARQAGRRAWIYNGVLPRAGTLLLDADPRGLIANGWIAAMSAIERWFYWESTFWDDDGPGGRGRIDPFVTAESFHNRDGDSALGDGLLVYPGRNDGKPASPTPAFDGVFPSLRLKELRRGIQDAGLVALALRESPDGTAAIVARALPRALDEAWTDRGASWETAELRFSDARRALRAAITRADPLPAAEIPGLFAALAARRRTEVPVAPSHRALRGRRLAVRAVVGAVVLVLFAVAVSRLVRRRSRFPR